MNSEKGGQMVGICLDERGDEEEAVGRSQEDVDDHETQWGSAA
jgi:hypothetical protein